MPGWRTVHYIYLLLFQPLYNAGLPPTATATKAHPNCQNVMWKKKRKILFIAVMHLAIQTLGLTSYTCETKKTNIPNKRNVVKNPIW